MAGGGCERERVCVRGERGRERESDIAKKAVWGSSGESVQKVANDQVS